MPLELANLKVECLSLSKTGSLLFDLSFEVFRFPSLYSGCRSKDALLPPLKLQRYAVEGSSAKAMATRRQPPVRS